MKLINGIIISLLLSTYIIAQDTLRPPVDYTNYGQMIYWKTLTPAEKKVFLFAYLYRTHEINNQVKADKQLKTQAGIFDKQIARPVFETFAALDSTGKEAVVFWIDKFYRNDFNKDKSFNEALRYAHIKIASGDKALHELFETPK